VRFLDIWFPHFTPQRLTIDGSWHEENQYLRFTGTIASSVPFVILSLLKCGETYHYIYETQEV
jgi:hypothetical protein